MAHGLNYPVVQIAPGWPYYFFSRSHPLGWPKLLDRKCKSTHYGIILQAFCFPTQQTTWRRDSNNSAYKPMSVRRQAYKINRWQSYNCSHGVVLVQSEQKLGIRLLRWYFHQLCHSVLMKLVQLCLRWTLIMLKLFHNFLCADEEWPSFHFSWWCQYECQYVCRGPLNLSKNEIMSRWQARKVTCLCGNCFYRNS